MKAIRKRTGVMGILGGLFCLCVLLGTFCLSDAFSAQAQSGPVWTGDCNVYGGESNAITLPLALNGARVESIAIEGETISAGDYSASAQEVTLLPSAVEALGRGAFFASVQTEPGGAFDFILYIGAARGEAVFFDFDLNDWSTTDSGFTPNAAVEDGIDGRSIAFDGSGGTLLGFASDGAEPFIPFAFRPRTRYRLAFDYQIGADTDESWNAAIGFGSGNEVIMLRADESVGIPSPNVRDTAARMRYFEDGRMHVDVTFVTPEGDACRLLEFSNRGGTADLLVDNLLLTEYSQADLKEIRPEAEKISAQYQALETDGRQREGILLRGAVSQYDAASVAEYGFLLCGPDGEEYSFACEQIDSRGEFALGVYDVPAGRYEARAYVKDFQGGRQQTAAAVVCVPEAQQEETADVYIIAGQSNAHGCSPRNTLTIENAEVNNAVMYYNGQYHSDEDRQYVHFEKVTASFNVETSGDTTLIRFGPELGLSNMLYRLNGGKKIYIIKVAQGGSELYDRWASPSSGNTVSEGKSPLYRWLEETMQSGAEYFADLGVQVRLKAFLWMQGETDAVERVHAYTYERNLRIFLSDVEHTLETIWQQDVSDMPFVIGGLHQDYDKMPYVDTVIEAQKKVASERDNYYFFDTTDLRAHDGWHYTGDSGFILGTRFAAAIAQHEGLHTDVTFHATDLTAQAERFVPLSSGKTAEPETPEEPVGPETPEEPTDPEPDGEDTGGCGGALAAAGNAAVAFALIVAAVAIGKRRGGNVR